MDKELKRQREHQRYLANKEAYHARTKAWREANRERENELARARHAADPQPHRDAVARWEEKHPGYHREYYQGHRLEYRQRSSEWDAANPEQAHYLRSRWRKANPEKVKVFSAAYRQRHPEVFVVHAARRRALRRALPATLTTAQWEAIKEAYRYRCAYCGKKPSRLTQDHVVPVTKGGGTTAENIVPACQQCNRSKGNRPPSTVPPLRLLL